MAHAQFAIGLVGLCRLVPRPGRNTILDSGVRAAHAKDRALIVPGAADTARIHDARWGELCKGGIGVDVLACPCGGRMRFIEIVIERDERRPLLDPSATARSDRITLGMVDLTLCLPSQAFALIRRLV